MSFIKKENLVIVTGQYTGQDGQQKNEYKKIGEIITMQGNDGPYQFFKLWGPGGVTEGKVFEAESAQKAVQQQPNQQYMQNGQPMNPQQVQRQMSNPDVPF